ncbi:hypothetical protein BJ912DRAFT_1070226 [Pholiota molesta]|nr:hypothetical protein BJ912DRAFT_1070226 [Pholiota molesta]
MTPAAHNVTPNHRQRRPQHRLCMHHIAPTSRHIGVGNEGETRERETHQLRCTATRSCTGAAGPCALPRHHDEATCSNQSVGGAPATAHPSRRDGKTTRRQNHATAKPRDGETTPRRDGARLAKQRLGTHRLHIQ